MLKILIADDHYMVREGVKSALKDLDPELKVLEAADLFQVLDLLQTDDDLDLILLDMKMPGMEGVKGLQQVKQVAPDIAVAILSAFNDRQLIQQALDGGADGYISKASNKDIMLNAIRLILAGEIYVPSVLVQPLSSVDNATTDSNNRVKPQTQAAQRSLTTRQREVLALMKNGLSNKEIAREIGCAEGTVKAHVTSILKAFGASSRAKVIALDQPSSSGLSSQ